MFYLCPIGSLENKYFYSDILNNHLKHKPMKFNILRLGGV